MLDAYIHYINDIYVTMMSFNLKPVAFFPFVDAALQSNYRFNLTTFKSSGFLPFRDALGSVGRYTGILRSVWY